MVERMLLQRRAELHAGVLWPLPLDLERKHAMELLFHRDTANPSGTASKHNHPKVTARIERNW